MLYSGEPRSSVAFGRTRTVGFCVSMRVLAQRRGEFAATLAAVEVRNR
jgi:hypothetical protein